MVTAKILKSLLPEKVVKSLKETDIYKSYRQKRLTKSNSISQLGQDYWVINEVFLGKKNGYFVEVGAADGLHINNTYLLEKKYSWSGICIEANPYHFKKLQANRNCTLLNICVDEFFGEVEFYLDNLISRIITKQDSNLRKLENIVTLKTVPLKEVLDECNAPKIIDYLSMDVEGAETRILRNFPFQEYCFLSITIERPSEELQSILTKEGYIVIKAIPGMDYYYIHESYQEKYYDNLRKFYRSQYMPSLWGIF